MNKDALIIAVQAAITGDWHKAHSIAQDYNHDVSSNNIANWIHAVLHKIEGDESNSKYWYARTILTANIAKNTKILTMHKLSCMPLPHC